MGLEVSETSLHPKHESIAERNRWVVALEQCLRRPLERARIPPATILSPGKRVFSRESNAELGGFQTAKALAQTLGWRFVAGLLKIAGSAKLTRSFESVLPVSSLAN